MALERIKAAMKGAFPIEDLSTDEKAIFDDLVAMEHWERSGGGNTEFAAKLVSESGNVGYDDEGNLVETDGKGGVRIIKPAPDDT